MKKDGQSNGEEGDPQFTFPATINLTLSAAPAKSSNSPSASVVLDYIKALMWPLLVIVLLWGTPTSPRPDPR